MGENSEGVFYNTTLVKFLDRFVRIVVQNEVEDCDRLFVSFCNALLLRGDISLDFDSTIVSQPELISLVGERLLNSERRFLEKTEAMDLLHNLASGIHVDVHFKRINDYEPIRELAIFNLLDIGLYHGWIVDPQDSETAAAIGSKSYSAILRKLASIKSRKSKGENESILEEDSVCYPATTALADLVTEKQSLRRGDIQEEEELMRALALSQVETYCSKVGGCISGEDCLCEFENRTREVKESDLELDSEYEIYLSEIGDGHEGQLMQNFLDSSPSQLTYYGLFCLMEGVKEQELCVFFHNNHFSTMLKFKGELYLLEIAEAGLNQDYMLWKKLNEIGGDPVFVTGNFEEFDDAFMTVTFEEFDDELVTGNFEEFDATDKQDNC